MSFGNQRLCIMQWRCLSACFSVVLTLGLGLGNSATAKPRPWLHCDRLSFALTPKSAHGNDITAFQNTNGVAIGCSRVFPRSASLDLLVGASAMSFVNSYDVQSYALGLSVEYQYRFVPGGHLGAYAGLDVGLIYGYEGYLSPDWMIGPLTPAAEFSAGLLYEFPDRNLILSGGVHIVPPTRDLSGVLSPTIGLSFKM